MARRKRNKNKQRNIPIGNYDDQDHDLPFTNDPGTQGASSVGSWSTETATTASSITDAEDTDDSEDYSPAPNNWPTFATDVMRGLISINASVLIVLITLVWFSANLWLLIQDNSKQLLQTLEGWRMYGNKVGVTTILIFLTFIPIAMPSIFRSMRRWMKGKQLENKQISQ